jgi:DNA polymerase-3 subunit delta'
MAAESSAVARLSSSLCPWLEGPLAQLDAARQRGTLAHGWLIKGPAGIGKINLALVFARRLLDEIDPATPVPSLGADAVAAAIEDRHAPADHDPDLHWIFPEEEKRTIAVEQVRDTIEAIGLKGFRGRGKVVIVEPAEAMTVAAANALLKTLEEPTPRTFLLLVSHRPDRLLPTIRSRCQSLPVARPDPSSFAAWLGMDEGEAAEVLALAGGAPLRALALLSKENSTLVKEFEDKLQRVSRNGLDAQSVADEWCKKNPELALEWLIRRLQRSIRHRMAARPNSNAVTDTAGDPLHNAWLALSVVALYERLDAAEKLLDQLGSGINAELAMRVLLLGFQPERGRT